MTSQAKKIEVYSRKVDHAKAVVAELAVKLAESENPLYELSWGSSLYDAAAEVKVYSIVVELLKMEDKEKFDRIVLKEVVRAAKPEFSTSPLSNYAHQLEAKLWVKVYEELVEYS
jgi:hypothetical protein